MKREDLNRNWVFYAADQPQKRITVRLPHDAMQTEKRVPKLKNGPLTAFFPGGDYYYEKTIRPGEVSEGSVHCLDFGGVFMDSSVYLNGKKVGGHVYGYSNFYVDLSKQWRQGEENRIRVFVHNSQIPNSRWYSGAGIYRPVYLLTGGEEHILPDGIRITTLSHDPAVIEVTVESTKSGETETEIRILYQGKEVTGARGETCRIELPGARLWDDGDPQLYTCRAVLRRGEKILDEAETVFGVRHLEWDGRRGLLVNGRRKKLVGACLHHDQGILGAAENKAAALYRVRRLKESGFNAVRGAHNPRSREFLEACDELGMYVIEEFFDGWFTSGTYGYPLYFEREWARDMELSVRKCYSHPSVICYSIGNEVAETAGEKGLAVARKMVKKVRELDPFRPVTMGVNLMMNTMEKKAGLKLGGGQTQPLSADDVVDPKTTEPGNVMDGSVWFNFLISLFAARPFIRAMSAPKRSDPGTREIFALLDLAGYNYGEVAYVKHRKWYPNRLIVGTETKAIGVKDRIAMVRKYPWLVGDFVWTGWDYLGECGLGIIDYNRNLGSFTKPYPALTAGCGMLDLTGHRETMYYDWALAWGMRKKPYLAVSHPKHAGERRYLSMYRTTDGIDSWTFPGFEGTVTRVRVAGLGKQVELFVNGTSCGKKRLRGNLAEFRVRYEPGELRAVTLDRNGHPLSQERLVTAVENTVITVLPSAPWLSASEDDVVFLEVILTDEQGIYKPMEKKIRVSVEGAARLWAVGSGNVRTKERFTADTYTTCNGRMTAAIRSVGQTGQIRVRFFGEGLETREVTLQAENRPLSEKYQGGFRWKKKKTEGRSERRIR